LGMGSREGAMARLVRPKRVVVVKRILDQEGGRGNDGVVVLLVRGRLGELRTGKSWKCGATSIL
jgi:hypothetical protein